jgi:hypothetical protein
MKTLFILTAWALSFSVNAADLALIKFSKSFVFTPNPQSLEISVLKNGTILKVVTYHYDSEQNTQEILGHLSAYSLNALNYKIARISAEGKLVDPNANEPFCMDAPSSSVVIEKNGKEMTIVTHAGCHTFAVEEYQARQLADFIEAFEIL